MGELTVPLEIAAGIALLLVVGVALISLRRITLARTGGSFDCSLRSARSTGAWTIGVARYGPDRLDWYRVFSLSPRPSRCFQRERLEVAGIRVPQGGETLSVLPGMSIVSFRHDEEHLDLAMAGDCYTGLASWLESAPPGRTGRVT